MTIDHPVRRLLARVCSAETLARVVDPTLADVRVEEGRLTWRGLAALTRALTLHVLTSLPTHSLRVWTDDGHAVPRAILACALTTAVFAAPFVAMPMMAMLRISWRAVVTLLPQALAVALPPSLLVAIPLAFRGTSNVRRVLVRGLALSALCAAATSLLIILAVPDANQAFRVEAMKKVAPRAVELRPGPAEMTLHQLREQIDVLRLTAGGVRVARRLEYTYQLKLALCVIAVPLGFLAIGVTIAARGRRRPLLAGIAGAVAYLVLVFTLDAATLASLAHAESIPLSAVAWMPLVAITAAGAAVLCLTQRRGTATPCV